MYYIWHGNSYPTYKAQLQAKKQYDDDHSVTNYEIQQDANDVLGTENQDTTFPKSKLSDIVRGVNWRSYAPNNSEDEWKWMPHEHKWVRIRTDAIRNAYIKWDKAIANYNSQMSAYRSGQSDREPNVYAINRDKANLDRIQARVNRHNQEANAWFHENYNSGSFYTIDTRHTPNMQQYLANLSDDQLNNGIKYWNRQLITPHTAKEPIGHDKYKTVHYNTGDAVMLHHEQNYNDPANLVNQAINGGEGSHSTTSKDSLTKGMIYQDGWMTHAQGQQLNNYGRTWSNDISNLENLHAKLQESTNHYTPDYSNTQQQYQNAKKKLQTDELQWKQFMKTISNKDSQKAFHQLMTSGKRQLMGIYYLDHTYYDRDMWRLNAYKHYLPIRHQNDINASIHAQVKNNQNNNLTSIYRADRKTDQVIGFVETTPNESIDMNLATEPVDNEMPQTNYAQTNQMQLTDTGDLYDRPLAFNPLNDDDEGKDHEINRWDAYNVLRNWEQSSIPLVIIGFNYWPNILIQSLSKQPEQTGTQNALQITMTIQKVRLARILWGKKPKATPHKGRNNAKGKVYKVRPGDCLSTIAHGNVNLVHQIIKANPQIQKNPNLIYPGWKLVIPNE